MSPHEEDIHKHSPINTTTITKQYSHYKNSSESPSNKQSRYLEVGHAPKAHTGEKNKNPNDNLTKRTQVLDSSARNNLTHKGSHNVGADYSNQPDQCLHSDDVQRLLDKGRHSFCAPFYSLLLSHGQRHVATHVPR